MKRIALSFALVAFAGGIASAQRVKNVAIEEEQLSGELPRPMLDRATGRNPASQDSLIAPRTDFVREIVKSARDL
jgi:hypothetical protein